MTGSLESLTQELAKARAKRVELLDTAVSIVTRIVTHVQSRLDANTRCVSVHPWGAYAGGGIRPRDAVKDTSDGFRCRVSVSVPDEDVTADFMFDVSLTDSNDGAHTWRVRFDTPNAIPPVDVDSRKGADRGLPDVFEAIYTDLTRRLTGGWEPFLSAT